MKHNKKRNTAFLYECLIKEMTKAVVRKDLELKEQIVRILKQYFSKGTVLAEDLQMYKELMETKGLKESLGNRFLEEVKSDWENLDRKKVFNEQTRLIKQINEHLDPKLFSCFVDQTTRLQQNLLSSHQR